MEDKTYVPANEGVKVAEMLSNLSKIVLSQVLYGKECSKINCEKIEEILFLAKKYNDNVECAKAISAIVNSL